MRRVEPCESIHLPQWLPRHRPGHEVRLSTPPRVCPPFPFPFLPSLPSSFFSRALRPLRMLRV